MTAAEVIAAIQFAKMLAKLIEKEVDTLRRAGEMTPDAEAAYQRHQREVYSKPESQPESSTS